MKDNIMKNNIIKELEANKTRGAWDNGVNDYAIDLVDGCEGEITKQNLLNGADDWEQYSEGGCALIYDTDICIALCCKSEQLRKDFGRLEPNSREGWLDVQARALFQACNRIMRIKRSIERKEAA